MKVLTEQWHQKIQNRISTAVQRAHRLESLQLLPREIHRREFPPEGKLRLLIHALCMF